MQIFTLKISCSPFGFSVVQGRNTNSHKRLRAFVGRRENAFRFLRFIFNLQYVYGMFHCGLHKMFCFIQEKTQLPVSMWSLRSLVISHFRKKNVPKCSLYKYIYLNIYIYIEAENRSSEFLNDLMTNDLNDHFFSFSCFVMFMQTAIIQGVKNCLPLWLADGAFSTDPSPTRQKGRRRPTS